MQACQTNRSLRTRPCLAGLLLCLWTLSAPAENDAHVLTAGIEGSFVQTSTPLTSWLEGGLGKLRNDENTDGLSLYHSFMNYSGRLTPTLNVKATLIYNPEQSSGLDFSEAFLEFRPVPRTAWRARFRVGAFYPHITMENIDVAWTSPYTLSSSTINTWLAEEVRTVGLESRFGRNFGGNGQHGLNVEGAIYWLNDPTGALLSAKGWSLHDRQTGITGELPLRFGTTFEPFKELDHRAGYYVGGEYRYGKRLTFRYHHYNNHGDPTQGPDWGDTWQTFFDAAGLQLSLPWDVGLIGQWIDGRTIWQGFDAGFDAWSTLLTRPFGKHRVSIRYDDFYLDQALLGGGVQELDRGSAWTVAWLFHHSQKLRFALEWLEIESTRPQFVSAGFPATVAETQIIVSVRYLLSNQPN